MSIVFLEVDPADRKKILGRYPDSTIIERALAGDALVEVCKDAAVVSCFIYSSWTKEVIHALPKLKLIITRSVGTNHIDLDTCRKQGIIVANVPDYGSHVIAEHAFALLLAALRNITVADKQVESGQFDYHGLRGMALRGKTIGIVGTGKIGSKTAEIALGFGMKVLAVDTCRVVELEKLGVQYVDLPTLEKNSDIITLHIPLLPETEHMIDAAAIDRMKNGVVIINTARGELIDSAALLAGLQSGKVAKALLDVLEHERDFTSNKELISHPNVITTPHIAFYADDSVEKMYEDCFDSIDQWSRGEAVIHAVEKKSRVCDLPKITK